MNDRSRRFALLMTAREKQYPHESYHDRFVRCSASPEGAAIWEEAGRAKHPSKTQNAMMAANSFDPSQPRDEDGRWTDAFHGTGTAGLTKLTEHPDSGMIFGTDDKAAAAEYAKGDGEVLHLKMRMNKVFDHTNPAHVAELYKGGHLKEHEIESFFIKEGGWDTLESPEVSRAIKAAGFDSLVFDGFNHPTNFGGTPMTTFAVFSPDQIKITGRTKVTE